MEKEKQGQQGLQAQSGNRGGTNQYDLEIAKLKGTNENDVEIAKLNMDARATTQFDVEIERIRAENHKLSIQSEENYKKAELEMKLKSHKFTTVVGAAKWVATALTIGACYIVGTYYDSDVAKHKAQFGAE